MRTSKFYLNEVLLQKLFSEYPERGMHGEEPILIKNLENVQVTNTILSYFQLVMDWTKNEVLHQFQAA